MTDRQITISFIALLLFFAVAVIAAKEESPEHRCRRLGGYVEHFGYLGDWRCVMPTEARCATSDARTPSRI